MPSKKIMVVEDEMLVSESIQQSLKKLGYDVAGHASTGEQAVELARRANPDLVLMDINLPGNLEGIEAAREIRGELSVPVVYLTGYSDPATVERAQISAPYGYIVKPFTERELEVTISIALYRQQIDKEKDRLLTDLQRALAQDQVPERDAAHLLPVQAGARRPGILAADRRLYSPTLRSRLHPRLLPRMR